MPMNKEAEQMNQTPEGVKLQGTLLICLAVAMVIAGASAAFIHYKESVNANQQATTQQEVQLNEETTDTKEVQGATVPAADDAGSGAVPEPAGEPDVEPDAYVVPPAKETTILRCIVSTYDDGSLILTCFPLSNQ